MTVLNLKLVEADHLLSYWPQCAPLLERGLADSEGEMGAEDLLQLLLAKQGFMLIGVDSAEIVRVAMALQFHKFPNYKVAHIYSIGGRGVLDNRRHWASIKAWMKEQGASKVQGSCKPAQARLWQRLGLKQAYSIMRQDI